MSNITMDQVAVMGVQYFHYTLDYYLNSMHRCGVKNLDLWGASPHYCRLDYLTSSAAERKLREIRKKAEDFGLIFSIALFLVCLNNLILMMNIASRCKTLFYRLVAVGLGVTYGVQVFLTVGGAIKFIPMTGVTLPFVSYGGSSILSSLIMFALINGMYNMRQDEGDRKDGRKQKTGQTKKKTKHTK